MIWKLQFIYCWLSDSFNDSSLQLEKSEIWKGNNLGLHNLLRVDFCCDRRKPIHFAKDYLHSAPKMSEPKFVSDPQEFVASMNGGEIQSHFESQDLSKDVIDKVMDETSDYFKAAGLDDHVVSMFKTLWVSKLQVIGILIFRAMIYQASFVFSESPAGHRRWPWAIGDSWSSGCWTRTIDKSDFAPSHALFQTSFA